MKIVQVAPDVYPIPPENYGGIERVMYDLTEELVKRGHEVLLYAREGSTTSAKLIPFRHNKPWCQEEILKQVVETLPRDADIVHDHTHASIIGKVNLPVPTVCTEHFSANCPVKYPVYASKTVQEKFGGSRGYVVHHGIRLQDFSFSDRKENYLFFIGKLDASKGPQFAVDIAEETGKMLILAGPIHDAAYFERVLKPRISTNPNIHYIGEVGGGRKQDLMRYANCVLFPTLCEESFGLVAVEAMACGTPVLAFRSGAVPEILSEFPRLLCSNVEDMAEKTIKPDFPHPVQLRNDVESKYTVEIMTNKYIHIYEEILRRERFKN